MTETVTITSIVLPLITMVIISVSGILTAYLAKKLNVNMRQHHEAQSNRHDALHNKLDQVIASSSQRSQVDLSPPKKQTHSV